MKSATAVAVGAVRAYQWTLGPMLGGQCRFYPSCSEYAVEALRCHGVGRGALLAGVRVLRCNPWCAGGVDLVPDAAERRGR
jgi:uncharacterized protein